MNRKLLLIIVVVVVALVGVGAVALPILRKPSGEDAEEGGHKKAAKAKKPEATITVPMEEFLVNLADASSQHYLKTVIALEVPKQEHIEEHMKEMEPKLRDVIITTMSRRRFNELLTERGKADLKKDIKHAVNKEMEEEKFVSNVFYTSFAMQ